MKIGITKVKETCLYVSDLNATRRFYEEGLGLPVISLVPGRHVFFRAGESVLLCFIAKSTRNEKVLPPHYAEGKQHIAFEVPSGEYSIWKAEIERKGIAITHEEKWKKGISSFYFEDPDGHVVEILPPGLWD